jgi:hypothetical protein
VLSWIDLVEAAKCQREAQAGYKVSTTGFRDPEEWLGEPGWREILVTMPWVDGISPAATVRFRMPDEGESALLEAAGRPEGLTEWLNLSSEQWEAVRVAAAVGGLERHSSSLIELLHSMSVVVSGDGVRMVVVDQPTDDWYLNPLCTTLSVAAKCNESVSDNTVEDGDGGSTRDCEFVARLRTRFAAKIQK